MSDVRKYYGDESLWQLVEEHNGEVKIQALADEDRIQYETTADWYDSDIYQSVIVVGKTVEEDEDL